MNNLLFNLKRSLVGKKVSFFKAIFYQFDPTPDSKFFIVDQVIVVKVKQFLSNTFIKE
jgi:hypothetical protein